MDSLKILKQLQNKMEPNYWLAALWHVYRKLATSLNLVVVVVVISNKYVFYCVTKWSVKHHCNLLCWLGNTTDNSVPLLGKLENCVQEHTMERNILQQAEETHKATSNFQTRRRCVKNSTGRSDILKNLLAHYTRIQIYRVAQSMKELRLGVSGSQEPKIIFWSETERSEWSKQKIN